MWVSTGPIGAERPHNPCTTHSQVGASEGSKIGLDARTLPDSYVYCRPDDVPSHLLLQFQCMLFDGLRRVCDPSTSLCALERHFTLYIDQAITVISRRVQPYSPCLWYWSTQSGPSMRKTRWSVSTASQMRPTTCGLLRHSEGQQ